MKFKLLGAVILSSALVLTACGQSENNSNEESNKKPETKSDKKSNESKKDKDNKSDDKNKKDGENSSNENKEDRSNNEDNQNTQEQNNDNQNISLSNIQDRNTLESIIYGNYTEEQKIQAYNSAVANNVIPQGTVSEGSAVSAYESSIGLENGETEKDQMAQRYQSWVDAGIMTEDEMQEELSKFN